MFALKIRSPKQNESKSCSGVKKWCQFFDAFLLPLPLPVDGKTFNPYPSGVKKWCQNGS